MAGIIPGPLVPGPEAVRRRYGLLTAASGPLDLPVKGKAGGLRYVPVTCGSARLFPIECPADQQAQYNKIGDPNDPEIGALPFTVYASIDCGAAGYTEAEFEAKVTRRLENGEQGAVEFALWTGVTELGINSIPLGIDSFASAPDDVVVPDDSNPVAVLAAVEDWVYQIQGYGNAAYVHAPVSVASWMADHNLVIDDGPIKRTPYGSVWVFGGDYPGTGDGNDDPPVGGAYLYVTGQVTVWRSPDVFVFPADQTMDRTLNQRTLLAEREYAVGVDCLIGRALFNPLGGS